MLLGRSDEPFGPAGEAVTAPPKIDDLARSVHGFNNCLQKLVYAVEGGDAKLVARCILDAQNMYEALMPEAAALGASANSVTVWQSVREFLALTGY